MRRRSSFLRLLIVVGLLAVSGTWLSVAAASAGPILLVTNRVSPNPYGQYLAEILRAEGIATFGTVDLAALDTTTLGSAKLVILAETGLTNGQASMLNAYVGNGGLLVAMRPDAQLSGVLGVQATGAQTAEGYIQIDPAASGADGFSSTTLPFHGSATNYAVAPGAIPVATLYRDRTTATGFPAVIRFGNTVTFAYDLARSVAYSRQGNPANAGVDRDGLAPLRTNDIFYNAIDKERVSTPHADIQMRLLGRMVNDLLAPQLPLPRLWYFAGASRTQLILTGDAHGNPDGYFQTELASVEARGGQISVYLPRWSQFPTAAEIAAWRSRGHEFGMHPYGSSDNQTLDAGYQQNLLDFTSRYGPPSRTARNHQVEWQGWVDAAKVAAASNVGLDTNFYTWGPAVRYPDGRQAHGYITGSALPMRFVDQAGTIVPVYQQVTSLIDEQLIVGPDSEHMTPNQALAVSQELMDASETGAYAAIMTQFHVDYYTFDTVKAWAEGTMDYARSRGIPMWTAERWLRFTETRHDAAIDSIAWDQPTGQLSFRLASAANTDTLSILLPLSQNGRPFTSVRVDGQPAAFTPFSVSGRTLALVSVAAGNHTVNAGYGAPASTPTPTNTPVPATATATLPPPPTATSTATLTPTATATATQGPTSTATATATATLTPTQGATSTTTGTPTPKPAGNAAFTQRTAAEFAACGTASNTMVTRVGDGAVQLAGTLGDEYQTATLNASRWVAGTWSGASYTPTLASGVLSLSGANGAFVRSSSAVTASSLEATAQFSGAPWQHVGWGSLDFSGDQYLLFSTFNGSTNLYARSNAGGGEQRTDLGPLPAGFHDYRITRSSTTGGEVVSYYVDGTLRAQHTVSGPLAALYAYQSTNSGGTAPLLIDRLWATPPFVTTGSFQSCALDAGTTVVWSAATWSATVPAGTSLQLRTRTSADGTTWTAWSAPLTTSGQAVASPDGRYLQYVVELSSASANTSAALDAVTLSYTGSATAATGQPAMTRSAAQGTAAGPDATAAVASKPSVAARPSATPPAPAPVARVERVKGKLVLSWFGDDQPEIARYRVRRITGAQTVKVLADVPAVHTAHANGTPYQALLPATPHAIYWLEALRADGSTIVEVMVTP